MGSHINGLFYSLRAGCTIDKGNWPQPKEPKTEKRAISNKQSTSKAYLKWLTYILALKLRAIMWVAQ